MDRRGSARARRWESGMECSWQRGARWKKGNKRDTITQCYKTKVVSRRSETRRFW